MAFGALSVVPNTHGIVICPPRKPNFKIFVFCRSLWIWGSQKIWPAAVWKYISLMGVVMVGVLFKKYCWRHKLSNTLVFWGLNICSTKNTFSPRNKSRKWYRVDIRCTRLQMMLRVFFVLTGIPDLRRFCDGTILPCFTGPKRIVPGQVWIMDHFSKQ